MIKNIKYNEDLYSSINMQTDFILMKKIKNEDGMVMKDGIYIPGSEEYKNKKIGVGEVLDIGSSANEKYGVKVGDYVIYDYYSAHGNWPDCAIIDAENLIAKISEEEINEFI